MYSKKTVGLRTLSVNAAACAMTFALMGGYCDALAEPGHVSPQLHVRSVVRAELERAFWVCDYTATMRGVEATPIEMCSAVTDELKHRMFGGDFEEMLDWWRQNKLVEHQKLDAGQ